MSEFDVLDSNGIKQPFSITPDANGKWVGSTAVTDPATGAKMQVGIQHQADGQTLPGNAALDTNVPLLFNGTTFDRQRGNADETSGTSSITINGASAGTVNGTTKTNYNHRGAQIGVNITQISASTTLTITVQGQDVVSGVWYNILQSIALGSVGFTQLTIYPGTTVAANAAVSQPLPRTHRVVATIAGPGTVTATVGMSKIL